VAPPDVLVSRGWISISCLRVRRVAPTVPDLALTKALRSGASVPTRQRSSRTSRAIQSAATTGEPLRSVVVATESQQEATATASVLAGGGQAAAMEIPDDDAPPPGWHQCGNWPAPAPEPAAG
jgi:hypothetical protein